MQHQKFIWLVLVFIGIYTTPIYAQKPEPKAESFPVSWPGGYEPEYCQLHQSPDLKQLWWVCSGLLPDNDQENVLGFVFLTGGQTKPLGFLLADDQLEKSLNLSKKINFVVEAVTAEGNFLIQYSLDDEDRLALLNLENHQPKILWSEKLKPTDNNLWLGDVLTTANKEFILLLEDSGHLSSEENNYTDQAIIWRLGADGHEIWSYQNDSISAFQGRTLSGDSLDDVREYLALPGLIWQKRLLATSSGSIVVWGDAYINVDKDNPAHYQFGEFRTCLTSSGKGTKQIVEKYVDWMDNQYTQLVTFKNGDWLKIQSLENSAEDQEQGAEEFKLVRYNDHCDQMGSQVIQLPSNNSLAQESFHRIKAALMLPTEQLLLAYTQGEDPSLYVAIIDWKKGVIWNQPIILPDDSDAELLLSYDTTGRGRDFMVVGLGLLADQKSIFVSVSNPAIPGDQGTARYLNKLYQVMLPINSK